MNLRNVRDLLEEKGYKSEVTNYDVERLVVLTESECNPTLVIESLEKMSVDKTDEEVVEFILSVINEEKPDYQSMLDILKNPEEIKKHLQLCLLPKHNPNLVCEPFLDLYKGVRVSVDGMSVKVTNVMLEVAGLTREEVFEIAEKRAREKIAICNMSDFSFLLDGFNFKSVEEIEIDNDDDTPLMLTLSNLNQCYGAAAIVFDDVLEMIREKLGCDYYILPSSIHEVIVLKAFNADTDEINNMITEINETQVDPRERLSNHFYIYSKEKGLHYIQ